MSEQVMTAAQNVVSIKREDRADIAVLWMDWYSYHVARLRGMANHEALEGRVRGIELVGGAGVHGGLVFRSTNRDGAPIETLLPDNNWHDSSQLEIAKAVYRKLSELDPQVVLVPGYYTLPGVAAAVWAKRNKRQSVLMTETTAEDHARVWWKEAAKKAVLKALFDWAVVGGVRHKSYLEQLGFPAEKIARFYDVVDNEFFRRQAAALRERTIREQWDLPRNYFLYVGRLAPEKNVKRLMSAFADYKGRGGSWNLALVGEGPLSDDLKATARPMGDAVMFAGHKSTEELPVYYAFANAFVLPSTREPWGLVVNEAMASGLPVIVSSRCGCADDLVQDEVNGFRFDPSDTSELTARLFEMERLPEAKRRRMGQKSQALIDQYTPQALADEIARISEHAA